MNKLVSLLFFFLTIASSVFFTFGENQKVQAEEANYIAKYSKNQINILDILNENLLLSNNKIYKGNSVKVGILDTGIDYKNKGIHVEDGISTVDYTDNYIDDNGHGTHVAGIVASFAKHNGKVIGIAPDVQLFSIKSMDSEGNSKKENIVAGVQWAIDHDIDILNMSIGSKVNSKSIKDVINKAYKSGILIVTPVGNSGYSRVSNITYPAKYSTTLSVGSVSDKLERSYFSSTGSELDIVAPGEEIYVPALNGIYTYDSGTSMASPYITGVASILLSANRDLTNDDLKTIILLSADYLGNKNEYGYGVVDIPKALNLALLKNNNIKLYNQRIKMYEVSHFSVYGR
ncbi:S8 family peptidase [Priestia megaterium]